MYDLSSILQDFKLNKDVETVSDLMIFVWIVTMVNAILLKNWLEIVDCKHVWLTIMYKEPWNFVIKEFMDVLLLIG